MSDGTVVDTVDEVKPAGEAGESGQAVDQPSYLDMSDEDILKMSPPEAPVVAAAEVKEPKQEAKKEDNPGTAEEAQHEGTPPGVPEPGADNAEVKDPKTDNKEKPADESKTEADPKDKAEKTEGEAKDDTSKDEVKIDYEAEYKRLMAPFKANGKEMSVDSIDDVIDLMKMGANYNKKMAALKPNLKILKSLENNGLLDENKIGFLIDLAKKDPGAINKLVKDSGIDPMDLDAGKASAYKQNTYAVDDREIELDTVLEELKDSPTYTQTLDVVSNKWDAASKQFVAKTPQLLKLIDDHMASGIYERISKEMDRERVLGRLNGLSDLEAYRQVGDAIHKRGGFDDLAKPKAPQSQTKSEPVVVQPKPKPQDDDKLKDKKRAASSPQPAAPTTTPKDFNPLGMSDEEFSKLGNPKYIK